MKSFGQIDCVLCMQERIAILKFKRKHPELLINTNNKFYGACCYKPAFHTYLMNNPSTDEADKAERADDETQQPLPPPGNPSICTIVEV